MTEQCDAIHRDAQFGSKMVNIKRRAAALRFAVPAFVPAGICKPRFEQSPTTVLLDISGPKIVRG